jgi:hypothetical protein
MRLPASAPWRRVVGYEFGDGSRITIRLECRHVVAESRRRREYRRLRCADCLRAAVAARSSRPTPAAPPAIRADVHARFVAVLSRADRRVAEEWARIAGRGGRRQAAGAH